MKSLKFYLSYVTIIIIISSCKKYSSRNYSGPDATKVFTEKSWRLPSYGGDYTKDGQIESINEEIRDVDKGNGCVFLNGDPGIARKTAKVCNGNQQSCNFSWDITNNDSVLDFIYGTEFIVNLSADN